ncbi:MAG: zinc-dependent alcohol dehydrogenase family protein [Opitutales bacterium]
MQQAIRHHTFGKPEEVLQLDSIETPEPGPGEARVRLLAAAINPSDFGMIAGSYGRLRELPAVAGREGVGEVDALGDAVEGIRVGDRVRFPEAGGCWRGYACAPVDELLRVPPDIPVEQAAMSFINPPTAWCLLTRVLDLEPGDWVVQNAGNSLVGIAVVQMAKALGLHTISQVRREAVIEPLKQLGADHVVVEGSDWHKQAGELTGGAPVRLALNSVGGTSAIDQIKALGEGGTQVTFGGMVGDPVRFPTRFLIFHDIRMIGFWWDRWIRRNGMDAVREVMDAVYGEMRQGRLQLPAEAVYPLESFKEAMAHAQKPRFGKILLKTF